VKRFYFSRTKEKMPKTCSLHLRKWHVRLIGVLDDVGSTTSDPCFKSVNCSGGADVGFARLSGTVDSHKNEK
jgi:hypothetical protein